MKSSLFLSNLPSAPALITFLGAMIAASGVFWASVRNAASQREIIRLNRQLAEKSDELATLNQKVADLVTGGKGFAYVQLTLGSGLAQVFVINDTEYPLYDLSVRLVNLPKMEELKDRPMTLENMSQWQTTFVVGNLGPHQATRVGTMQIPSDAQELRYNLFFMGRNGGTTEGYRARKVNGLWKVAIQVTRDGSGEKLYEKIDPELPHPPGRFVEW
jgi:hypothetical protein